MKKTLSVLLTLAIIATLFSAMFITASAETKIEVNRLTLTATNLKLADDNMSEADAIKACTARLGNEVATRAIYSKTADGKYNYLSCFANTGWITGGTGTIEEIMKGQGMYGVMFVGTFEDNCKPVDGILEVKAAGAQTSEFNFNGVDLQICTEEELSYIQNKINKTYEGQGNVVCLAIFYSKERQQNMIMQFQKIDANKDCVASCNGECNTFDDYITNYSEYASSEYSYVVPYLTSFEMLDGKNQAVDLTKVDTVTFRSAGEFSSFVGFMIDGKYVDPSNYTVKAGSTIVEVKKSYLNTLSNGTHTVTIASQEGMATTEFTLSGATGVADNTSKSPKTGDDIALFIALMAVAFIGSVTFGCKVITER